MIKKKKSILFVRPDFHCSFFYRDQFRKSGWKADIYLPRGYPDALLYSHENLLKPFCFSKESSYLIFLINQLLLILWWLTKFWRYDYHIYYGSPPAVNFLENKLGLTKLFGDDFVFELFLSTFFGVKLIYLPSGCRENDLKETWKNFDNGNVCNNCGFYNKCDDKLNKLNFKRIKRYFEITIGNDSEAKKSNELIEKVIKYKIIDLNLWSPLLKVPPKHQLLPTKNLRILHSSYLAKSGRDWQGRNIKGSPFVLNAVQQLKNEGYPVEFLYVHDTPSNEMRFYQVQADIVVDQLIYGWWGSTLVEVSALGKPVVCYLRPAWKEFFLKNFPQYSSLPVVEADTQSIYEVLKKLVTDADYRQQKGEESRRFAEMHFNPEMNTAELIKLLEAL